MSSLKTRIKISIGIILLIIFALVLLPACEDNENEEQVGTPPIFQIGDTWTMRGTAKGIEFTATKTITGEDVIEGKEYYVAEFSIDPPAGGLGKVITKIDRQTMKPVILQSSGSIDGISFTVSSKYTYTFSDSRYPLKIGKVIDTTETETTIISASGESQKEETTTSYTSKVEWIEKISVPAGEFECFKIIKYDDGQNPLTTSWYSDKVKSNVKEINHETTEIAELISYSVSD